LILTGVTLATVYPRRKPLDDCIQFRHPAREVTLISFHGEVEFRSHAGMTERDDRYRHMPECTELEPRVEGVLNQS
jgi:hypothetical protein